MNALERISFSNDLLTLCIMLVLLLLVLAKNLFPHRFDDFISLFSSEKYLLIKNREHKLLFGFNVLMLLAHIFVFSLLIFTVIRSFLPEVLADPGIVLIRVITAYGFFVLLKLTIEKIIANVFDIDEAIDHYLFQKHSYRNFITVLIFPAVIYVVYRQNPDNFIFYVILGIFLLLTLYTFFSIIKKNQGIISRNSFYFILYLCALEITPYVILFKLITVSYS